MAQRALKATCLCKGVQFTLSGQDKGAVLCHCSNCKSFTGSSFAHNYRFMKAKVEYQKGEDLVKSYKDDNTKSGKVLERFFCGRCGSSLMNKPQAIPGLIVACTGAIQSGEDPLHPKFELFEEDRRPWLGSIVKGAAKL
ncbi:hypothetical protein WHR41_03013 [Cladosporium halotolerans]|uniref:CENP-V/GFA domain-containing protein n=1 Tax=Cladosporium halotolerans TaxID=1052096 RepID=A0AB34KX99_9PEZI